MSVGSVDAAIDKEAVDYDWVEEIIRGTIRAHRSFIDVDTWNWIVVGALLCCKTCLLHVLQHE